MPPPAGRASRPVTCSAGALLSRSPSVVWKRTFILEGTRLTLANFSMKSRCHENRLNSPSVTTLRPISSCSFTTSRIALR